MAQICVQLGTESLAAILSLWSDHLRSLYTAESRVFHVKLAVQRASVWVTLPLHWRYLLADFERDILRGPKGDAPNHRVLVLLRQEFRKSASVSTVTAS